MLIYVWFLYVLGCNTNLQHVLDLGVIYLPCFYPLCHKFRINIQFFKDNAI